MDNRQLINN